MSLVHSPFAMPNDRTAEIIKENEKLRAELADLREQLRLNQQILDKDEQAVMMIRTQLHPLYNALMHLFEQIDSVTGAGVNTGEKPRNSTAWESWKQKLGGKTAQAIDVLLMHGAMNRTQLRIQLGCATGTVVNVVAALNKAGLINKNGNQISLKEL